MMAIDRAKLLAALSDAPFHNLMHDHQWQGLGIILTAWETHRAFADHQRLAYVLATTFHETDFTMQPIEEVGHGGAHAYGVRDPVTGQRYYGRGYVQLTWRRNYALMSSVVGRDLVHRPELALDPAIAAEILIYGMERGSFTGKKFADFFTPEKADWFNARRIINGLDKAAAIEGYAKAFYAALRKASAEPTDDLHMQME